MSETVNPIKGGEGNQMLLGKYCPKCDRNGDCKCNTPVKRRKVDLWSIIPKKLPPISLEEELSQRSSAEEKGV